MQSISTITPAADLPVSVAQFKAHLRLNDDSEDDLLGAWIEAAADLFARQTGYVPLDSGHRLHLDGWPDSRVIEIPRHPLTAIDAVEYLDAAGDWQQLAGWAADVSGVPARVVLPDYLPALHASRVPCVRVDFTAGHATAEDVPVLARVAVQLLAAHWYANREAYTDGDLSELPSGWRAVVNQFSTGLLGGE